MHNNGKINKGIDLGTTNSAIAVMENGIAVIKKTSTQKDTMPSIVSVNRRRAINVGDIAANELANQVLRATKTWDKRHAGTDIFKEFKRTMGTVQTYRSKNLKKDFTSEELSAEIIKALSAYAEVNDGGSIVISVPAKFDATQKTATINAAYLAGFQYVELIQEPIAAAITYGVTNGQSDGFWLVFDLGGGTFDGALLRVDGGVQQVVDTEGDSFLGGKDIDFALVDKIFIPYIERNYTVEKILASESKSAMLRQAMKHYAEMAKVQLSTSPSVEVLSDLGELGCDDNGNELELDLTITREMANPIMYPFFERAIVICKKILERNNLDGSQLSKLILVGGPTYSPCLRQMLKEQLTPNVDTSIDPMTAVAKGAALYAATRDIPEEYVKAAETNTMEVELHYDTMSVDSTSYLAVKVKNPDVMTEGMSVEVVRADGAWRSGNIPYEDGGIVVELSLVERSANNFSVNYYNGCGQNVKIYPDSLTVLQGMQVSAAPLPYNIGFGVWNSEMERQTYVPFFGLEKGKPLPAKGIALGRKTTMRLVPGEESSILRIPVYQASNGEPNTPATLHEHVADVVITGKDVKNEVPAGSEVTIQVAADSSEMMTFTVSILNTDEEVVKKLDTSPRFNEEDSAYLIEEYADEARRTLESLESENVVVDTLKSRLHILKMSRHYTETKAIVEKYKELLRDIYDLECSTAWERIIRKVEREMAILKLSVLNNGQADDKKVFLFIERYIESAKENQDVTAAKKILGEIELLSIDLRWKTRIPSLIRWYDRYFDTTEWEDNKRARTAVDKALELLETSFSKEELMKAFRSIICALKNSDEIREAQGLLG